MAYSQKDWQLSSYTNSTDTDFITDAGTLGTIVKTIIITNTTAGAINVMLTRTTSGDADIAEILPLSEVAAYTAAYINVESLSLTGGDKIRAWADAAGINFDASGADDA